MPTEISPQQIQTAVKAGFDRMRKYRMATAMFVKEFVGEYYRQTEGLTGDEPLNLLFQTLRATIPTLVSQNPVNRITSQYTAYKQYAELASLGLDLTEKQLDLKEKLRAWIVSAFFGLGVLKIGIKARGQSIDFGDASIDPGQLYIELVDLDDFVIDPTCTDIKKSLFYGHRISVPRQILLDTDGYDHDLVKRLPSTASLIGGEKSKKEISQEHSGSRVMQELQDEVDVVELYVPEAESLVTIPDPRQITFDGYLRQTDFYGPKEGQFVFLSLTPPVPGNPLPIAPVSLIYDLHKMVNSMFNKVISQAEEQKDIILYEPAQVEEADAIKRSRNTAYIPTTNAKGFQQISLGGQNQKNEMMLAQLQIWFNYMANNPDQLAGNQTPGTKGSQETATRTMYLQNNASVTVADSRDILYDKTAEIGRRLFWYLHYDPLIDLPIPYEKPGKESIQLRLTPEDRRGNFLDYTFKLVARSMTPLDPATRSQLIISFTTNIMPAVVNSAAMMMRSGQQFNIQTALTRIATELDILEYVEELFNDPEYQNKLAIMMALGPQNTADKNPITPEGVMQNGGAPNQVGIPDQAAQFNAQAQQGVVPAQEMIKGGI